jgi:hypothetical protein
VLSDISEELNLSLRQKALKVWSLNPFHQHLHEWFEHCSHRNIGLHLEKIMETFDLEFKGGHIIGSLLVSLNHDQDKCLIEDWSFGVLDLSEFIQ